MIDFYSTNPDHYNPQGGGTGLDSSGAKVGSVRVRYDGEIKEVVRRSALSLDLPEGNYVAIQRPDLEHWGLADAWSWCITVAPSQGKRVSVAGTF